MDSPEPKKSLSLRLHERLAASRFFTFSLLLHVVIVIVGGGVILLKVNPPPQEDFQAPPGFLDGEKIATPPEELPPTVSNINFNPVAPQPRDPTISVMSSADASPRPFVVATSMPVAKPQAPDLIEKTLEKLGQVGNGLATGGVPDSMFGRIGSVNRNRAREKNGGKPKSEEAVLRGLRWLAKEQAADGSWGKSHPSAMTGLALLCFLGHGETPVSPEFGPAVQKGAQWIMEEGAKNSGHLCGTNDFGGQPSVYEHGIASYALGEYYSLTHDERAVPVLKQAIGYIVSGQGSDGGWMYSYDKSQSDTSVSGWQVQALKAAHLCSLNINGVDAALDKAMLNFKRVQGDKGGIGYRDAASERYSLTGVGVLCTYFWKQNKDELVRDGIKYILDKDKPEVNYKAPTADLYAWYYNTQACLMVGGPAWTKWNRMFQDQICDSQSREGSWPPMSGGKVTGNLQQAPAGDGPVYRTTLCLLMLEVYYRYMPTTKA